MTKERLNQTQVERIAEQIGEDWSQRAIASEMDLTPSTVSRWARVLSGDNEPPVKGYPWLAEWLEHRNTGSRAAVNAVNVALAALNEDGKNMEAALADTSKNLFLLKMESSALKNRIVANATAMNELEKALATLRQEDAEKVEPDGLNDLGVVPHIGEDVDDGGRPPERTDAT